MMQFPITTLLDEQACYDFLLHVLHPGGFACPHGHVLPPEQAPHDRWPEVPRLSRRAALGRGAALDDPK